jgi:hypothetical protein
MAREQESARYREAAEAALGQLMWCIEYLRGIRKTRLSEQLARNHAAISRRLRDAETAEVLERAHDQPLTDA